jgi:hypothetical protein
MKINTLVLCIAGFCLMGSASAQKNDGLSEYGCHLEKVTSTESGTRTEAALLFVTFQKKDEPVVTYTTIYLLEMNSGNIELVSDSDAFYDVYDYAISPDGKAIALTMAAEGHPWVEIYDLKALITQQKKILLAELNPYPGTIDVMGWKEEFLIVESDADLLLLNDGRTIYPENLTEKPVKYLFNIYTKMVSYKK